MISKRIQIPSKVGETFCIDGELSKESLENGSRLLFLEEGFSASTIVESLEAVSVKIKNKYHTQCAQMGSDLQYF